MTEHAAQIDWTEFERSATGLIAERLGLVVDEQIFRGGIPQGVPTGVGVVANSLATVPYYGVSHPTFDVQVLGRFLHRDEAATLLSRLYSMNIERGAQYGGFAYIDAARTSEIAPYQSDEGGRRCWCVSVHYRIKIQPVNP